MSLCTSTSNSLNCKVPLRGGSSYRTIQLLRACLEATLPNLNNLKSNTWLRLGLLKPHSVGGVAKQNSLLSTSILSADDGGRKGVGFSELCEKKESAGKAGLREKG